MQFFVIRAAVAVVTSLAIIRVIADCYASLAQRLVF